MHTYIVQFTHEHGNGWAIMCSPSPSYIEQTFKNQTRYVNARITSFKEIEYIGNETCLVYEGDVTTYNKSPYDIAVWNGFRGTEVEWLASLKGEKGDKGDRGEIGPQGPKGDTGAKGDVGLRGQKGDKGDKGDTGEKGEKGDQGIQGTQGEKGDAFTYEDFTPEQLLALKGEKGAKGDKGDKGDTGNTGANGNDALINGVNTLTIQNGSNINISQQGNVMTIGANVPTNVSAFTNDAGYLTQHQSLTNYVQKSQTAGLLKNDGTVDTNTYLTQHQSLQGYAKYYLCQDETEYESITPKLNDTLYLIPES